MLPEMATTVRRKGLEKGRRCPTSNLQCGGLSIPRGVICYVTNIAFGFNSPESIRGGIMQQKQSGRSHNN